MCQRKWVREIDELAGSKRRTPNQVKTLSDKLQLLDQHSKERPNMQKNIHYENEFVKAINSNHESY